MRYFSCLFLLVLLACSRGKQPEPMSARKTAIQGIGDAVVTRCFLDLQNSVNSLNGFINSYTRDSTSTQKLLILRSEWTNAVVAWKLCSIFLGGKFGSDIRPSQLYATANRAAIEDAISSNIPAFNPVFIQTLDETSIGLSAIEYLIFGTNRGDVGSVILAFKATGSRRGAFLRALGLDLKRKSDHLMFQWSIAGEGYIYNFMAATGPERSSTIGVLADNMIATISKVKNDRIGAPLGANGVVRPELVESKYGGESITFIRTELQSVQQIFSGLRTTSIGVNAFDWLLDEANSKYGDIKLSTAIRAQFADIYTKLDLIKTPLEDAVLTTPNLVRDVYESIERLQTLIQNDMLKGLNFKQ
jgi:predicted lipoprotein